ncbi:hypothetical protein M6B38_249600 [Iris pallida]|uniref:Uncharacterized protein n=1 Tax=Iris pallida TaxID=29817 RepID=A0AAX6IJV7_IRIPA|nr:hypothetical protein M6B38_249600 [Iris pallida]
MPVSPKFFYFTPFSFKSHQKIFLYRSAPSSRPTNTFTSSHFVHSMVELLLYPEPETTIDGVAEERGFQG